MQNLLEEEPNVILSFPGTVLKPLHGRGRDPPALLSMEQNSTSQIDKVHTITQPELMLTTRVQGSFRQEADLGC